MWTTIYNGYYHEANFELWLDSNGYKMEWDEENDRARWVKDDKK